TARQFLNDLGLGCATDTRYRDTGVHGRTHAGVEQARLQEDLAVGDRDHVGRNEGGDVTGLRFDNRQRGQRTGFAFHVAVGELLDVLFRNAGRALQQTRVQIEHVAGIRFASGRTAQQQGDLAIGPGLLGQIVINDQRVLTAVAVVLADGAAGEGCEVLHGGRIGCGGRNDHGVGQGAVFFQLAHDGGDRRSLLADGDVHALNTGAFLVDDGIDRDRGFTDLAVADDQFALAAADRHHRVDGLEADLYRLINRLTPDNAGRNFFDGVGQLVAERAFAIDRDTERIEYAAFQLGADRHFEDATGAFALLAFGDTEVIAENDGADRVALEVQRHAVAAAVEFDHLTVHDVGEAVDTHDTVRYGNDGALVLGLRRHIELVDALFDDFANLGWIQLLHVCSSIPSLRGTHCFWEIRISYRLCAQRFRQLFETSAHGAIDHHIAGADHYATDQVFVDDGADTDIALQLA